MFVHLALFAHLLTSASALKMETRKSWKTVAVQNAQEDVEAVFVQFDSRDPTAEKTPEIVKVSTKWNAKYAKQFLNHKYLLLNDNDVKGSDLQFPSEKVPEDCHAPTKLKESGKTFAGPRGCDLHIVWAKVKAMLHAEEMYPSAKYFKFMDSDMLVTYNSTMTKNSIPDLFSALEKFYGHKAFYTTTDDESWWGTQVAKQTPYDRAVNTGLVLWRGGGEGKKVLKAWWDSSMDSYEDYAIQDERGNQLKFRQGWPWDQAQMQVLAFDERKSEVGSQIMVFPKWNCRAKFLENSTNPSHIAFCSQFLADKTGLLKRSQCEALARHVQQVGEPQNCFAYHFSDSEEKGVKHYAEHGVALGNMLNFKQRKPRQQEQARVLNIYKALLDDHNIHKVI